MLKALPEASFVERFVMSMPAQAVLDEGPLSRAQGRGYAFAALAFVVSFALRWALDDDLPPGFPFLTFIPAVVLISFVFGKFPGILISVASLVASGAAFIPGEWYARILPMCFFMVIAAIDITIIDLMHRALHRVAHVQARAVLLAEERDIAVQELGHRIKNLIANVSSLINFAAREAKSVPQVVDRVHSRLGALGVVSGLLQRGLGANTARVADIIAVATSPVAAPAQLRIDQQGLTSVVAASDGLSLSMIFHELATNAVKHGALSSSDGLVVVTGSRQDGLLVIEWREAVAMKIALGGQHRDSGDLAVADRVAVADRIAVAGAKRAQTGGGGFGTRLIERLTRGLGAQSETQLLDTGLVFRLTLPEARVLIPK